MKQYKEFKAIKKNYIRGEKEQLKKLINTINEQQSPADFLGNWWLKELLTNTIINKININNITLEEVKAKATKKAEQKTKKQIEKFCEKCDKIAQAEDITEIIIKIEWVRSSIWGYNPHAEVWARGYTTGTASGCGYDKRSAAVANAFNKNHNILKLLYTAQEKNLRSKAPLPMREALGYGSGYMVPYFEGGVGYSSFEHIFQGLGFSTTWGEGKTWDYMTITRKGKGAK